MKIFILTLLLFIDSFASRSQQLQPFGNGTSVKGFLENKGQIRDQNGKTNLSVLYLFNDNCFNLELRNGGFSYELFTVVTDQETDEAGFANESTDDEESKTPTRLSSSCRIDVEFIDANPNCFVSASGQNKTGYNFYYAPISENHFENVRSFQAITYHNIYKGIDLVFSAPDEKRIFPEYTFIVHPGADPSTIQMKYNGASALSFTDGSSMRIGCYNGFVKESKPHSFIKENNLVINCNVVTKGFIARFNIGNYDQSNTLIIDPAIRWGTYYGGESTEDVAEVAVDSHHKPTVAGNTLSTYGIATTGAYQTTFAGGFHDFFIAKFNENAQIEWATYLGGSARDLGFGVEVDHEDNIYFNGKSNSDGLATADAHQTERGGGDDAVVAKFKSDDGALMWCTYVGGAGNDQYRAFVFDDANNMYLCGYTESETSISTVGAFQEVYAGGGDGMITKWTPDGEVIWSTYYGASGQDRYHCITTDLSGDIYIVGTTSSTDSVFTDGSYQTTYGGGEADMWLNKFTSDGQLVWSTLYGGELHDRGRGVETDSAGNIYVAGFTNSTTGIATLGAHQETWSPGYDAQTNEPLDDDFLFSISNDGTTRYWGTYYGGNRKEELWGMNIDRKQQVLYVVGSTYSETMISFGNAWQSEISNGSDAIFAKWNYDGSIIYGSYFGKNGGEQFEDVEVDDNSDIYLVGKTGNDELPVTYGVYQVDSNGGTYDGMLYKFYGGIDCRDIYEPNDAYNDAPQIFSRTTIDSLIYGYDANLVSEFDKDFFRVSVEDSFNNLFIELTNLSHNYDLRWYNSQMQLENESTHSGLIADTLNLINQPVGDHYIEIVTGAPEEFDTMKCYHLNLVKTPTVFSQVTEKISPPFKIYPNPASSEFYIDLFAKKSETAKVEIFDMSSRLLKTEFVKLIPGFQTIQLQLYGIGSGIYRVVVTNSERSLIGLIAKQ